MPTSPQSTPLSAAQPNQPRSLFDAANTRLVLTLKILVAAACGMTLLLALLPQAGHDQLWLLLAAQRAALHLFPLQLDPYGPTNFESNPPLALWLSGSIAALARFAGLPLALVFKTVIVGFILASGTACARLLARLQPISLAAIHPAQRWFLLFTFVTLFGAVPARDFGQRDHLVPLLALPYLLAAALDCTRRPLPRAARVAVTLLAAFALAIKPHQALIAVAVELTAAWQRKRLRLLEPTLFLLAAALYFAAIKTLAPTFLSTIYPLLRDTYWAFGTLSLLELLQASLQLQLLLVFTLSLYFLRSLRGKPQHPDLPVLLAAGLAAECAYLLQGTGWYYQQLPALSFFGLAFALQVLDTPVPIRVPNWLPTAAAALTLLALTLAGYFSDFHLVHGQITQPQPVPDPAFFANLPPGAPVATLTTTVDDTVAPAFLYHLTLAQRYPHLWLLPALLRNETSSPTHKIPPARLAQLEALQHRFMVEDLTRWRPTLILVARCQDPAVHCQVLEDRHDDLLAWFLRDPAFAHIFSHYRRTASRGMYDSYTLNEGAPN